jgi:hypothetical protein
MDKSMQADKTVMAGYHQVLDAYAKGMGEKKWALVGGRLDEGESRFPSISLSVPDVCRRRSGG